MGIFGDDNPENVLDDSALVKAARKRLLRILEAQGDSPSSSIVNNITSGSGSGSGLTERMNGAEDPADRDYFVDILREDLPEINEATGKPRGWKKSVHRRTQPKGK